MYKVFIKGLSVFFISNFLLFCPQLIKNVTASIIFSDNFNRSDSTSLGPNWELFYGGQPAGIENDQAYIDVGAGGYWGFYKVSNLNIQDQDVKITYIHQNGDTTLLARVIDLNNRIAINYYQTGKLQIYEVSNGNYRSISNTAPNAVIGNTYTVRARIIGNSLMVWVNDILYADATLNQVTSGSAGFGANDGYTRVFFDNFIVEDGTISTQLPNPTITPAPSFDPTPTPVATPTTTPTPTTTVTPSPLPTILPTPTPLIPIMDVSNLKQYEGGWEDDLYGHTNKTIGQWGCALTSASMVLDYHGHEILPNQLNKWLKLQPDGFIRNGLVNWLAISRYTKENYSPSSRTLEYKRLPTDNPKLDNELTNEQPAILNEDGHFIVATGKRHDEIYTINDPGYSDRLILSDYSNNYLAINSYTPTDSDLSYMMFVADKNINLELIDENGKTITTQNFIEDPINDISEPNDKSGDSLSFLLHDKPDSGKYKLKVTGIGNYNLDSYLYDINGVVTLQTFSGKLLRSDYDIYDLTFNSNQNVRLSPEGVLNKLKKAFNDNQIKNMGIYTAIKIHLEMFDRLHSEKTITLLIKQVENLTPKLINQNFSTTLQLYLNNLIK